MFASDIHIDNAPPVPAGSPSAINSIFHHVVSGGWQEGDAPGYRLFAHLGSLDLENGGSLPSVTIAYETWGTLNADKTNAVLILHALTGDAHISGPGGKNIPGHPTPGWWNEIVGPGKSIDTTKYFVVAPNVLGGCGGTTGPSSFHSDGKKWGSRFPSISVRDQIHAEAGLADQLSIERWALVIGVSMGGQRALEWAVTYPDRVDKLTVIASDAQMTAEQAAWAHTQILAIESDPNWCGGDYDAYDTAPLGGLALARQIAHITYRSPDEFSQRFGRLPQESENILDGGRLAIQSYLDHHGRKLIDRFDAGSYVALSRAMLTHDVGRDRGGILSALRAISASSLIVAVDSDRLFFPRQLKYLAESIPHCQFACINSVHGHDGFLIESDQVTNILNGFIDF